jgi:hypothetical protein
MWKNTGRASATTLSVQSCFDFREKNSCLRTKESAKDKPGENDPCFSFQQEKQQ